MPNPFWNREQHRLRAFWRLLLQVIFMFILIVILSVVISSASAGIMIATHQLTTLSASGIAAALSTPLVSALLQFASSLSMLGSVWLAGKLLDRRKFVDFGFHFSRDWWINFGFGLFLGAALMLLIFTLEFAAGWVNIAGFFSATPNQTFLSGILVALLTFILVGIGEESLSRAYQLRNIAEGLAFPRIGPRATLLLAYFISSIVFGMLHLSNPNTSAISTVNLMVAGLFLGLGFILTGELAIPIGLHIAWNFFQGNVFGFPVSGTQAGAAFIAIHQGGPELVTGGAFGPEAGLAGLFAIAVGSVAICAWVKYRTGKLGLAENLVHYPITPKAPPADAAAPRDLESTPG